MTTPHPADTAKPGDAFHDELVDRLRERLRVSEWLLAEAKHYVLDYERLLDTITEQLDCGRYEQIPDAINQAQGDLPAPDASDPAHVRFAAVVCDAAGVHTAVTKNAVTSVGAWLRALADRLDVDAADRAKAEQIARDHLGHGRWTATVRSTQNAITESVLAGIRAGRDAERGA